MSEISAQNLATLEKGTSSRPLSRGLWVVIGLTALMVHRLAALFSFSDLGEGTPDFWVVAFTGDTFIGVTAPIVAFMLWKNRGLAVWTTAIVWHVIGIKDYSAGAQFAALETPDGMSASVILPVFAVGISVHLLCIFLLVRCRRHYLG